MRVVFYMFLFSFLVSCRTLPIPDAGLLKDLGNVLPGASPVNPLEVAKTVTKAVPNVASIPKPGIPSPGAVASLPRMPIVPIPRASLPAPGRIVAARRNYYAPVTVPRRSVVVPTVGLRPIYITSPYSMTVQQRSFTRIGMRGLEQVNAADPARRAVLMEDVLKRLLLTPYIQAQPLSVRQSLTTGSLDQRWVRMYSIYGYPVSVPYYYYPERRKVEKEASTETVVYRTSKEDAEAVALYLAQLQMFLLSMVENTGVIHAKNGKLVFKNTVLPKNSSGNYHLELVDGHGTIGITSQAVRMLENNKLSIVGKSGLNNIVMEPALLKDLDVAVKDNGLQFGKSLIEVRDVENLFIGGEQISLANLQESDTAAIAEQIKTAIAKAPAQPVFVNNLDK